MLALSLLLQVSAIADDLEQLRTDVRTASPAASAEPAGSGGNSNRSGQLGSYLSNNQNEDDDWISDQAMQTIVLGAVVVASVPFWGPIQMAGDDYSVRGYFPRYPYQEPVDGHLMIDPDLPRKPRGWCGRAFFDYRTDFDDLTAWGGGLQLDTTSRFGLDASAHYFAQQLPGGGRDELVIGSGDLLFRFAQAPWMEMRTGVGVNWLADSVASDVGVNFTYGGDWYPLQPLVVSLDLDLGKLGEASLFHARVTTGVQLKLAELYVGYDYLDVGKSQFNSAIAGVRFSF